MARTSRRSVGRRADLRWTLGIADFEGITATAASTIISAGNTSQTIMRTRGSLLCSIDGPTLNDVVHVGVGFLIIQSGGSATSTPIADGDAPYFWVEYFTLSSETGTPDDQLGTQNHRLVIDSKAMRVLRPDQEVTCVVEISRIVGTPVVDLSVVSRFLIAD